jgi:hypothetical protein
MRFSLKIAVLLLITGLVSLAAMGAVSYTIVQSASASMEEQLDELVNANALFSYFNDIILLDTKGNIRASVLHVFREYVSRTKWCEGALEGRSSLSDVHAVMYPNGVVLDFSTPVRNGNAQVVGVLIGHFDMERVRRITEDGEKKIVACVPIMELEDGFPRWSTLITLPEGEAFAAIRRARLGMIAAGILCMVLATAAGLAFSRKQTSRVIKLVEGTRRFGELDFHTRIEDPGARRGRSGGRSQRNPAGLFRGCAHEQQAPPLAHKRYPRPLQDRGGENRLHRGRSTSPF